METEIEDSPRDPEKSRREKRWSMNSQRLEEILAELMKPIKDIRRSFDTDLSALLEEYLTEAGLHVLDADEGGEEAEGGEPPAPVMPNFAELALLLQQSASIYGHKVDLLYQDVITISQDLLKYSMAADDDAAEDSAVETSVAGPSGAGVAAAGAGGARRRARAARAAPPELGFEHLTLVPHAAAGGPRAPARPPPTLPRQYWELAPQDTAPADMALTDFDGEPIGLFHDYHVTWRLDTEDAMLAEDLSRGGLGGGRGDALRPVPLLELQAALGARASPLPALSPPPSPPPAPSPPPPHCSTPLAGAQPPALMAPPELDLTVATPRKERKRKTIVDLYGSRVKLFISDELRASLCCEREFSVCEAWVRRVVAKRARTILAARRALSPPPAAFRGFDHCDVGGFLGWPEEEAREGWKRVRRDSDDDGFFDHSSSVGGSESSRASPGEQSRRWGEEAEGGGDVRALAAAALSALPASPAAAPFARVLRARARHPHDVSRLLLATLFMANAGTVVIEAPPPLSLNGFSLRRARCEPLLPEITELGPEPPPR